MGARGVLVPYAVDNGDFAFVIELLDRPHVGVEGQLVVYGKDFVLGNADAWTGVPVMRVGVGNDGVEIVVGSGELEHNHHRVLLGSRHFSLLLFASSPHVGED